MLLCMSDTLSKPVASHNKHGTIYNPTQVTNIVHSFTAALLCNYAPFISTLLTLCTQDSPLLLRPRTVWNLRTLCTCTQCCHPGRVANPRPVVATMKIGRVRVRLWLVAWRNWSWLWRPVLDLQRQRAPGDCQRLCFNCSCWQSSLQVFVLLLQ